MSRLPLNADICSAGTVYLASVQAHLHLSVQCAETELPLQHWRQYTAIRADEEGRVRGFLERRKKKVKVAQRLGEPPSRCFVFYFRRNRLRPLRGVLQPNYPPLRKDGVWCAVAISFLFFSLCLSSTYRRLAEEGEGGKGGVRSKAAQV